MMRQERTAVVIGAGMAGLAAAGALSEGYERVFVLERDALPAEPAQRPSVPQGRHVHLLLAGGYAALSELFPGLGQQLLAAGAVAVNVARDLRLERPPCDPLPARDLGVWSYALSRPLLEHCVRERVRALPQVTLEDRCQVVDIVAADGGAAVAGVRYRRGDEPPLTLPAELVVDASGRGELALSFLHSHGFGEPDVTSIGVEHGYASALFEIPPDASRDWLGVMTLGQAPLDSRGGLLLPVEHGRWLLSLGGRDEEQPPGSWDEFMRFVHGLRTPTIARALASATRVGEPARYGIRESRRQHFEQMSRTPRGLVVLGDALCRVNPVSGQGMSVAAQQAVALLEVLREEPVERLAQRFFVQAAQLVEGPWNMSAIPDFVFRRTRGKRPANLRSLLQWNSDVFQLAARDERVHGVWLEVGQLLRPESAYEAEGIRERLQPTAAKP